MPFDPTALSIPTPGKRPKTGGRRKGTPNKSTAALREAVFQVFGELQAEAGRENGHFLDWARDNPTDFYKLTARILPRPIAVPEGGPTITEIRRILVRPGDIPRPAGDS